MRERERMHFETGLFLSRITNCCISLPNDLFIYFPLFAHPFYFISCTIVSTCIQISFHFLSKPLLKCFVFSKTRGIATRFACLLLLLLSQDDVMIIPSLFSLPFLTCSSFSSNVIFVCCLFQKKKSTLHEDKRHKHHHCFVFVGRKCYASSRCSSTASHISMRDTKPKT